MLADTKVTINIMNWVQKWMATEGDGGGGWGWGIKHGCNGGKARLQSN